MPVFADGIVGVLADPCDLVFLLSNGERVTDGNILLQLARGMLDHHLGEVGMRAVVEQDHAAVRFKEFTRQLADGGRCDFVFYAHSYDLPE